MPDAPAHHVLGPDGRLRGFRNVHAPAGEPAREITPGGSFMLDMLRAQRTKMHAPRMAVDPKVLATTPKKLRLTWLGHTAVYAQFPKLNVLFDPMLSERASPFAFMGPKRLVPPAVAPVGFPKVDAVVFSHDHYDHLDAWTTKILIREYDPLFVVPLGMDAILKAWGASNVVALDWYESTEAGGVTLTCTPARHFSGRGLTNRNRTLWASWYLQTKDIVLYFGGDSAFGTHYAEMAERMPRADVALLPIGAYDPRAVMAPVHMDPVEAVEAARILDPGTVLPTHWGTFVLTTEPVDEPPRAFLAAARMAGLAERVRVWKVGESVLVR